MSTFESGIVFVGENFHRLMFDAGELFQSEPDRGEDSVSGPLAQFSYGSGAYKFVVVPDRVSVLHTADAMMSEELYRAGETVAEAIREHQQPHEVQGLGMNVQARLTQAVEGPSGVEFCHRLMDSSKVEHITAARTWHGFVRMAYYRGGVQYALRIEPELTSEGANLFMHVNAHQNITEQDDLRPKVALLPEVKAYLMGLYQRIEEDFGGRQ